MQGTSDRLIAKAHPSCQVPNHHRSNATELPRAETLDRLQTACKWNASETIDSLTKWALSLKQVSSKVLSFLVKFFFSHTRLIKRNLEIKSYLPKCLAGRCLLEEAVGNLVKLVMRLPSSLFCKTDITLSTSSYFWHLLLSLPSLLCSQWWWRFTC